MSTFDIMSKVEYQAVRLERARAVLSEIEDYFTYKDNAQYLPNYAGHILLLIHVTDGLLLEMLPELNGAIDALLEVHKNQKYKGE